LIFFKEYEQQVDEIVAACGGDVHAALKALMLLWRQCASTWLSV
jgi:hypothetical protein